jgi:hypothetical protein
MSPLEDKFAQFGQAIAQCAPELVELINLGGEDIFFEQTSKNFNLLSNLELILGNVAEGHSASSLLMEISRLLAKQDITKRLAPDVDEWLAKAELRISQLNNALVDNKNDDYALRLGELRELVLVMREGLINEALALEISLNTKFGHVDSIKDKQAENKYLISRISRLADKLMLLDFKRLRGLSGDNPDLLHLLVRRLHSTIESCRLSLNTSLPRLKHLLWEFEKRNKEEKLVWIMHDRLVNQSIAYSHIPSNDELRRLNINVQKNELPVVLTDVESEFSVDVLSDLAAKLKPRPDMSELTPVEVVKPTEFIAVESEKTAPSPLAEMESKLFDMVTKSKTTPVSCLSFWKDNVEHQTYPSGFIQWAHKTLLKVPGIHIDIVGDDVSDWSDDKIIYDFILDCRNVA